MAARYGLPNVHTLPNAVRMPEPVAGRRASIVCCSSEI